MHWPSLKSTILIENWQWIYPLAYTEKLTIGSLYGQLTIDAITVRKIADLCVHCTDNCNWCVHFMHNWRLVHSLYGQLTIGAFTVQTIDDWCVHCTDNWRLMRSLYGQLTIDVFIVRTIDDLCVDVLNILQLFINVIKNCHFVYTVCCQMCRVLKASSSSKQFRRTTGYSIQYTPSNLFYLEKTVSRAP